MQLLSGLKHYHDNDKMHRDIKPGNVLLQLIEYLVEGLVKCRCVAKYTDHGEVASIDRLVKGRVGTPRFCASEVLDGERYNEMADIFSLGVLFLYTFAKYYPTRDRRSCEKWPSSSPLVEQWMKKVDRIIEEKCHPKYQTLLRGMLLRNPEARWPVDKCLDFMLKLDQSQTHGQTSWIGPKLPWTTGPLTAEQIKEGCKRKYQEFECDNVVKSGDGDSDDEGSGDEDSDDGDSDDRKSDDGESDDAKIVIPAASDPPPNGPGTDFDQSNDSIPEDDAPVTPKLSCVAQPPVTPCREAVEEDALPSAACTPIFDDRATGPTARRVADQAVVHDFHVSWDWNDSEEVNGSDLFQTCRRVPRAATRPFAKAYRRINSVDKPNNSPSQRRPENASQTGLQLPIFAWDLNSYSRTSCSTTIKRVVPSQQLTENIPDAIMHARDDERSKESGNPIPDIIDSANFARQIKSSNDGEADSEAETEIEFEDRQPEAPFFSHRVAQTKAPIKTDRGDKQPEALNGFEPIGFPKLSKNRQREVLKTTQPNRKKNSRRKFPIYEDKSLNMSWMRMGVIR